MYVCKYVLLNFTVCNRGKVIKHVAYVVEKRVIVVHGIYKFLNFFLQAFSVFFICIALTSDMICFFFIPVHWLFFAASTYVWVQYVWHTGSILLYFTLLNSFM